MKFGAKEIEMTNYDIFMLNKNKKKAQHKLFDRQNETPINISYENYKKKIEKKHRENYNEDYRDYLRGQLERRTPERILTEDEFCQSSNRRDFSYDTQAYTPISKVQKSKSRPSRMSKLFKKIFGDIELKKSGKIFIAFYVLIVIAVASILIVVNSTSFSKISIADATSDTVNGIESVQPMVIEEKNAENQDWFDKLCDSLNK